MESGNAHLRTACKCQHGRGLHQLPAMLLKQYWIEPQLARFLPGNTEQQLGRCGILIGRSVGFGGKRAASRR